MANFRTGTRRVHETGYLIMSGSTELLKEWWRYVKEHKSQPEGTSTG